MRQRFRNYAELVSECLMMGRPVDSRYGPTKELVAVGLAFPAGELVQRPKMNRGIGWIEMLHLLAGIHRPDDIARVAPKADLSLFTLDMAYGPRVKDQVLEVIEAIKRDSSRRQAVLFIGKPENGPTSSQPCTSTIQFLRSQNTDVVDAVVSMRSWDLVKGLPYDGVMFGGLLQAISTIAGFYPGMVYVTAGSAHVYDADAHLTPIPCHDRFQISSTVLKGSWADVQEWADVESSRLQYGETPDHISITKGESF